MSRATDYQFVSTDSAEVVADLTAKYEELTGHTLLPSDPDKLFIQWVAGIIIQQRIIVNYAANQNLPSRAAGENPRRTRRDDIQCDKAGSKAGGMCGALYAVSAAGNGDTDTQGYKGH